MKLTVAIAALIYGTNASKCQEGLRIEAFTDDKCMTIYEKKPMMQPTEDDLKN